MEWRNKNLEFYLREIWKTEKLGLVMLLPLELSALELMFVYVWLGAEPDAFYFQHRCRITVAEANLDPLDSYGASTVQTFC